MIGTTMIGTTMSGTTMSADDIQQHDTEADVPVAERLRRRRALRQGGPADNIARDGRNVFATMAVFAGISSWVPLVIVVALPLTYAAALLALLTGVMRNRRRGLKAAWVGVVLATAAAVVHVLFAGIGGLIGIVGTWLSGA